MMESLVSTIGKLVAVSRLVVSRSMRPPKTTEVFVVSITKTRGALMTSPNHSKITTWTLFTVCLALAVLIGWAGLMVNSHYPRQFGVAHWSTNIDGRLFTDLNEFDKAVEGKSREQVLSLLGNPDSSPAIMDVMQCFRSGSRRQVLYYSAPKFGMPFILQAVELSNDKVTWTYRTVNNPLWVLLYAAVFAYGILTKQSPTEDPCTN